jgi:putative PIN family toxin of toxin-antitoxin system
VPKDARVIPANAIGARHQCCCVSTLVGRPPRRLLRIGRAAGVTFFTSAPLLAELTDILSRPKFERKITASLLSIDQLVDLYAEMVAVVRPISIPRLASDPDDDVVIGTAIAAKADFVVTGDRTLLSVMEYEGGRIISVSGALVAAVSG